MKGATGTSSRSVSRIVDVDAWRVPMINTDTTIYWERPPMGAWFAFRHALLTDHGLGVVRICLGELAPHVDPTVREWLWQDGCPPSWRRAGR